MKEARDKEMELMKEMAVETEPEMELVGRRGKEVEEDTCLYT